MSVALHLYQQLRDAPDDNSSAKAIADAFEQVEERYPNLKEVATQGQLRETEVRLTQAIHRQTYWIIGSVGTIIGFIRLLDWLLANMPK